MPCWEIDEQMVAAAAWVIALAAPDCAEKLFAASYAATAYVYIVPGLRPISP